MRDECRGAALDESTQHATDAQLQGKITELEGKAGAKANEAKDAVRGAVDSIVGSKPTGAAPKLVLMGPPGAGE